jgi:uncharacterized membrane protein
MALRSLRERVVQTLAFELVGLALATPLFHLAVGGGFAHSAATVALVSAAVLVWSPLHNTVFDWIEWRCARRVASDRPPRLRLLHAVSHEVSSIVVTLPVLIGVGGLGLWRALAADIGLTLLYTGYAYVFHCVYDRLRPVAAAPLA